MSIAYSGAFCGFMTEIQKNTDNFPVFFPVFIISKPNLSLLIQAKHFLAQ